MHLFYFSTYYVYIHIFICLYICVHISFIFLNIYIYIFFIFPLEGYIYIYTYIYIYIYIYNPAGLRLPLWRNECRHLTTLIVVSMYRQCVLPPMCWHYVIRPHPCRSLAILNTSQRVSIRESLSLFFGFSGILPQQTTSRRAFWFQPGCVLSFKML